MAPYPKYRPSGIEWLGEVPEHWEVKRLRVSSARPVGGAWGRDPDGRNDVVCVRVADFARESLSVVDDPPTIRAIEPRARTGRLLRRGDLLIEKSGGGEKQVVGAVVMFDSDADAVCSNFIARLPMAHGSSSRFCLYVHAAAYRGRLTVPSIKQTTGIQNLDLTSYLNLRWCFPPYAEQCEIGSYLDREMSKLEAVVRKQQTLIERLREKRSALITETVTCGLPPDAARAAGLDPQPPLTPSGIEWLGDIPAHWEIKRLANLLRSTEDKVEAGENTKLPYIGMEQVESGTGQLLEIDPTFTPSGVSNRFAAGDILYGKLRPYLAKACCVDFDGLSSSELLALRAARHMDRRFLLYQLLADGFVGLMDACSYGTKMPRTSWDIVRAFVVGVPAPEEQQAIADYLDRETARLDALTAKIETAIERLREYRSALITAAVTGKVDVRSARRPAPADEG